MRDAWPWLIATSRTVSCRRFQRPRAETEVLGWQELWIRTRADSDVEYSGRTVNKHAQVVARRRRTIALRRTSERIGEIVRGFPCLLYTSDAADDLLCV